MAVHPLQAESVSANPAKLSLHSAAFAFEDLSDDLAQLSSLVHLASNATDWLDESQRKAFRAIMVQLDAMAARANRESNAYLEASRAARAAMQ